VRGENTIRAELHDGLALPEHGYGYDRENNHSGGKSIIPSALNLQRIHVPFALIVQHGGNGFKVLIDFGAMPIHEIGYFSDVGRWRGLLRGL
jgi:hypothetical protein